MSHAELRPHDEHAPGDEPIQLVTSQLDEPLAQIAEPNDEHPSRRGERPGAGECARTFGRDEPPGLDAPIGLGVQVDTADPERADK